MPNISEYYQDNAGNVTVEYDSGLIRRFNLAGTLAFDPVGSPPTLDPQSMAALAASGGAMTYLMAGAPLVFGMTGATVTRNSVNGAGDASYAALYTVTVPGGVMGPNGHFELDFAAQQTNSASTKAYRLDINGVQMSQEYTLTTSSTLTKASFQWHNKNSESVNECIFGGNPLGGPSTVVPTARNIDTSADMTVTLSVKWTAAASAEVISILRAKVIIYPGL